MDPDSEIVSVELPTTPSAVAFRDARWATRWIAVGIGALLLWHAMQFISPDLLLLFPPWFLLVVFGLAPQVFLLIFPFMTRRPRASIAALAPGAKRILIEFWIAVPVIFVTLMALAAANYAVERITPGSSLTPDAMKQMAQSPEPMAVYLLLVFACTFAPIAEEVFFRGFLYNAFRARMPVVAALLLQSFIFGFGHFFGTTHAIVATGLGIIMTLVYQWRKTLLAPIFVHIGNNFFASLGMLMLMAQHADGPVLGIGGDPRDSECVIHTVMPGSAADKAELFDGDVVTSFDGEPIRDFSHFTEVIQQYRPGDSVKITIRRHDIPMERTVVLQRRGDP